MQGGDSQRDGELKFPVAKVNQLPRQRLTARKYALQLHGRLQSRPIFETRRSADWLENKGRARRSLFLSAESVSTGGSDFFRAGTTHTHTRTNALFCIRSDPACVCLSLPLFRRFLPRPILLTHSPHHPSQHRLGRPYPCPPPSILVAPFCCCFGVVTDTPVGLRDSRAFFIVFSPVLCPGYLILHPPPPNPSRQWVATRSPHKLFQVQRAGVPACLPPLPSLVRSPVER